MMNPSTTIRVSVSQRDRLRELASQTDRSMADTLDAALEALRRDQFYRAMARSEAQLRANPAAWDSYVSERNMWLSHDLAPT
jgi:predicted transcriptional regulator